MKQKFLRLLLSCLLIAFTASGAFAVVYGQGGYESQGYSESTAWEINSAAVLAKVRDDVNSGRLNYECYFKLTKDIDLTGAAYQKWSPIGGTQTSIYDNPLQTTHFQGHFNGNGHTIKINISEVLTNRKKICNGLFGTMLGGSIKNLNVSGNIEVYLRETQELYVGGIVAYLVAGKIENCKFDGNVTASTQTTTGYKTCAGGIVGYAGWSYHIFSIKNCKVGSQSDTTVKATVSRGKPYAGGIVGYLDDNNYKGDTSEVSGNYSRVYLEGGNSGGTYGGRGRGEGIVENNTEVDPNEEPEPEPEPDPLEITGTFKGATLNTSYSGSAKVTGGTAPYKWTKSGVPTGMTYKASGATVKLSGKPTEKGTYKFKVTATDANKTKISKTFKIVVAAKPKITGTFNGATLSTSYNGSATVTGGTAPYTWTKSGVPTGMTYKASGATVKLSGKPTKKGTYSFKVTAKDSNGASVSKTFKIIVAAKPTLTGTFKAGTVGTSYSGSATVTGGTAPYTWKKASGTLPKGLKLTTTSTGTTIKLSKTPTEADTFTFKLTVTDSKGLSASKTFKVTIVEDDNDEIEISSINVKSAMSKTPEKFEGHGIVATDLKILSEDILWQGEGKDEDLFEVKANTPVRFLVGEWKCSNGAKAEVSAEDVKIYVDDKVVEDVTVSDEGEFTVSEEFVHDDFKVQAKTRELETIELFISAIEQ